MAHIRTGTLADRYVLQGKHVLRVRTGSGPTIDVSVRPVNVADAAKIYGGDLVTYRAVGRHRIYSPA